jgi:hypothetical protein
MPGLHAGRLITRGNLELDKGFTAKGEVNLLGAQVGGQVSFAKATLSNPKGIALMANWLTVAQDMFFSEGFTVQGQVRLVGAKIGGIVQFKEARFDEAATLTNSDRIALNLQGLRADMLFLRDLVTAPDHVDLTRARVGVFLDNPESWPRVIDLREFTYDVLSDRTPVPARQRLGWLRREARGYRPQPYEQLTGVYRRAGRDQDARVVAIAKQRARRRTLPLPSKAWSLLLDVLVGYGYRTWLAGLWLLGFLLAGWIVFDLAHPADLIAPNPPGERPLFHAGLYALDLLLPIGDLDYQGAWIARGWARGFWLGWILTGWVLATAVLAALVGALKRD